jgi:hypothetical protein
MVGYNSSMLAIYDVRWSEIGILWLKEVRYPSLLQVEQVHGKFAKLQELRAAGWTVEVLLVHIPYRYLLN